MIEVIFLIALGLIWIIFAVLQDLKKREIANWLNFSLIIFALGFRFFYCLFSGTDFNFFYYGLMGFAIFFILGNVFYYSKIFAGGDAKLMIALGGVLPLTGTINGNLNLFLIFILLFLIVGAIYGFLFSVILVIKNFKKFKKEFLKNFSKNKKLFYLALVICAILIFVSFFLELVIYLAVIAFIFPYLYFSAKSLDETCMIKEISTKKLTEGDWLYRGVRVKNRFIKYTWDGLTKEEIQILKKTDKKVLIRQGIPFSPVFLIAYLVWFYFFIRTFY
ncbi:MAG TPA: prepilin peptidase [Candidatus Pacearchaeota archaeon]|nr:prepilin peptidase [Candidatus Pacearchaeota archaeon]